MTAGEDSRPLTRVAGQQRGEAGMATRKRPMKVGLVMPTIARPASAQVRWHEVGTMARLAEDIGVDSLWVVDHLLYRLRGIEETHGCWECWSWLSALASCTRTVELGTGVLGLGFRNPALLAKMAATVEEISDGRLILGVGAGYHDPEYLAFGYPFRSEEHTSELQSLRHLV